MPMVLVTELTRSPIALTSAGSTTDPNNDSDWEAFVNSIKGAGLDAYLQILKEADAASNG